MDVHYSSGKDDWVTPSSLVNKYVIEFDLNTDVAAADEQVARCPRFITPEQNALKTPWDGRCWLNYPFSQGGVWWERAKDQILTNPKCEVICMLGAARTDTKAFHECVWNADKCRPYSWVRRIDFLKGRTRFLQPVIDEQTREFALVPAPNSAPFPTMVVVFHFQPRQ